MASSKFTPDQLAKAYKTACMAELQALKPGNVHAFADGHGMTIEDFIKSADVTAEIVARADMSVGERIYYAVEATRQAVGQNTNLGMLLLCVPIIDAALHMNGEKTLADCLGDTLAKLNIEDARMAAKAILRANPAGLGQASQHDVHDEPHVTLLELMQSAQDRDRIAWQYAHAFEDVMQFGTARYADAMRKWNNPAWSATALYLAFLTRYPDSHVLRKYGAAAAQALMEEAGEIEHLHCNSDNPKLVQKKLIDWDASLKQRGINPGTSADLTVAAILVSYLS